MKTVHGLLLFVLFSCESNKTNPPQGPFSQDSGTSQVLKAAHSCLLEGDYIGADSLYGEVLMAGSLPIGERRLALHQYLKVLINLRSGQKLRGASFEYFKTIPDTSFGHLNDLHYLLYTAMGYRYEKEFCNSLVYLDSLSAFVTSRPYLDYDSSIVIDHYRYLMQDQDDKAIASEMSSMKSASMAAHKLLPCNR